MRGAVEIGRAVGTVIGKRIMAKHFEIEITDRTFGFARKQDQIDAEARLDGIYVLCTNLMAEQSDAAATVLRSYRSLAQVERVFRSMKTVDLHLYPVFHWTAPRVRAYVLLCVLAWRADRLMQHRSASASGRRLRDIREARPDYLEWHMRQTALAPVLFDDGANRTRNLLPRCPV